MRIIRGQEVFPEQVVKSIFLGGPIPRKPGVPSWKPEAHAILEQLGYDGTVYDPELTEERKLHFLNSGDRYDYAGQIDWEVKALNRADVIVFWIDRSFPDMPALASNVEYGEWFKSGKVILGFPNESAKMGYLKYRGSKWLEATYKWQVPMYSSLEDTLKAAIAWVGEGSVRDDAECAVPMSYYNDPMFIEWLVSLQMAGHKLEDFQVEYAYHRHRDKLGRPIRKLWAGKPRVRIAGEDRVKDNEIVIFRAPTAATLLYYPTGESVLDWQIVLVSEYRSAVCNDYAMVYELPSGMIELEEFETFNSENNEVVAIAALREVAEETGLKIDIHRYKSRLFGGGCRQSMATMLAHNVYVFHCQLTADELAQLQERAKAELPKVEDNYENTKVIVATIREAMKMPLDWVNMGMIGEFLGQQSRS